MKKFLLIIVILLFSTGCANVNKEDYKDIIDNRIKDNSKNKIYNTYHNGYKYYLPKYMNIKDSKDYNEKINSDDYTYYLYVDVISFYENKNNTYNTEGNYINYKFNYNKNNGYLVVDKINDKYLVAIMYNYAKIEVKVEENDLNNAINNSIIILSTIKYDKDIIDNLIGDNKINSNEENLNIFDKVTNKSDFLDIVEEYDNYDGKENDIPDYDVVN